MRPNLGQGQGLWPARWLPLGAHRAGTAEPLIPGSRGGPARQGTRVDKAKLESPSPGWFSLTFSIISHSRVSLSFLVSSVSHPLNLARSPLGSLLGL